MHLIYHPEAEWELIEAAKFYERRVPSLGGQFLSAADDAVATILKLLIAGVFLRKMSGSIT